MRKKDKPDWLDSNYFAPKIKEEWKMWTVEHKWRTSMLDGFPLSLSECFFHSTSIQTASNHQKVTVSNPRFLKKNKIEIYRGSFGTTASSRYGSYGFRASSIQTVNEVLTEIAETDDFTSFKLMDITFYNADKGAEAYFKYYNSNGKGLDLYLYSIKTDDFFKEAKELSYFDFQYYIGNFYDEVAACKISMKPVPDCSIHPRF